MAEDGGPVKRTRTDDGSGLVRRSFVEIEAVPWVSCPHPSSVHALDATADGRWLYTAGGEGVVRRFDIVRSFNSPPVPTLKGPMGPLRVGLMLSSFETFQRPAGSMSPAAKANGTGMAGGAMGPPSAASGNSSSTIYSMAVHSEGVWSLTGHADGAVRLWSMRVYEGRCQHVFAAHKQSVSCLALAPGERSFVSGGWDSHLVVHDLNTGATQRRLEGHRGQVTAAHFYSPPAGGPAQLLTSSVKGDSLLWDTRQEAPTRKITTQPSWALSSCWSASGSSVFCAYKNQVVDEFDLTAGRTLRTVKLPPSSRGATHVAAFPDGKHVLCGSEDGLRIWRLGDGGEQPKGMLPYSIVPSGATGSGSVCASVIDPQMRYMITSTGDRGILGSSDRAAMIYKLSAAPLVAAESAA